MFRRRFRTRIADAAVTGILLLTSLGWTLCLLYGVGVIPPPWAQVSGSASELAPD